MLWVPLDFQEKINLRQQVTHIFHYLQCLFWTLSTRSFEFLILYSRLKVQQSLKVSIGNLEILIAGAGTYDTTGLLWKTCSRSLISEYIFGVLGSSIIIYIYLLNQLEFSNSLLFVWFISWKASKLPLDLY